MLQDQFKVKVVAGSNGEVVQQNPNKPEYGSIMFEQTGYTFKNNFLNSRRKVSFLSGTIEQLNQFATGLTNGSEVPGCLYTVEQWTPFYEGQQPKINPSTGRACLIDGAMVWSKTFYDQTGSKNDSFLQGEASMGDVVEQRIPAILQSLMLS